MAKFAFFLTESTPEHTEKDKNHAIYSNISIILRVLGFSRIFKEILGQLFALFL